MQVCWQVEERRTVDACRPRWDAGLRRSIAVVSRPDEQEVNVADQRTDTDVIDELITDHQEALQLLDRIASISDVDERRNLADIVISEIVRHSVSEEMYVYPAMREHLPDGEQVVEH